MFNSIIKKPLFWVVFLCPNLMPRQLPYLLSKLLLTKTFKFYEISV